MTILKYSAVVLAALFVANAGAEETQSSESKLKIEDVKGNEKVKDASDKTDEVITNRKLRAETGSKSKYSLSTSLNYSGGTIHKPLAANRPNITAGSNTRSIASLSGTANGKMRLGGLNYLKAGVGFLLEQPLQQTEDGDKDVSNPYVTWGTLYKAAGIQNVFEIDSTFYTEEFSRKTGHVANVSLAHTSIKEIGTSGVSVGLYMAGGYTFFDAEDKAVIVNGVNRGQASEFQSDYSLGAYPFAEYVINDTFNLRTISGVWVYEHARGADGFTFQKNKIYQSFGLGISVNRDIYLYPNIQVVPEDIKDTRTNVAMSATINML